MGKQFNLVLKLTIIFSVLVFATFSHAQSNGKITGKVTDSKSGEYLPGANIMLAGTNIGASSDKDGSYRIVNVPPGNYTLVVRYMGYQPDSSGVVVKSGSTTNADINLQVSYVSLDNVVVEGLRQGQVKALSIQRESNRIENVVSREQMENFPDANAADVLQRIPGVFIDRSEGEGRYVLIRGTEPRLTTVTVNGNPLATNRNQERYSQMDIIGSNQMSMIEVIKAITPDMDVNTIGGSVNIITRSAFDYPGTNLKISAGSGYSNLGSEPLWQGNINYSTILGENKTFGISFTANFDQRKFWQDATEFEWGKEKDVNNNEIPFALSEFDLLDLQWRKDRYGLGGSFEYRPNVNNKFYFNLLWNELNDDEVRGRTRNRVNKGDYLTPDGTLTQDSRVVRETKGRLERQNQTNLGLGGENHFGDLSLDYNFGYSYGAGTRKPEINSTWDLNDKVNLALNFSDPLYPKYTITNLDPSYDMDASNYTISDFEYSDFSASNKYTVGGLNLKYPYELIGYPAIFKLGAKYTRNYKDNGDTRWTYGYEGAADLTMNQFLSDRQRNDFMNGNYKFGPEADPGAVKDYLINNKNNSSVLSEEYSYWDSEGQKYNVTENVMAYYLMTDIKFEMFSLLAGFRHEFTKDNYDGFNLIYDIEGDFSSLSPISDSRKYNDLFPMVHVKFDLGQRTNVRLAYTRTMSRPNFWDLVPYLYLRNKNESIRRGNPDLVPTYANNYDIIASHYFSGIGIASASFFYKSLKDIIFIKVDEIQSGTYTGYENEQPINGGNADLYGFELNWQQELTFLPGFLSGFGIYANYTHTWANADLTDREGFLPGQSGDVGNLAISYEASFGLKARLSYAFQGKFIKEVGRNEGYDIYSASHGQLDFTASQRIMRNVDLYLEVVNLNNEPDKEYMGITSRPTAVDFFSWWTRFGLKYSL
ncbi:MAG: TonB-dependent receptor [Ignavibacteriaceae bacterium]